MFDSVQVEEHQHEDLKEFKNFLFLVHKYLLLPDPTDVQYEIADAIVHNRDLLSLQAFRGIGKSHIAAIYCLWLLYWELETKILIVSATGKRANQFVKFCKDVIASCPFLQHMRAEVQQRNSATSFDVYGCIPSQTASLEAKGITSQITGSRANVIIADDLEISVNSQTHEAREKLDGLSVEFTPIMIPDGVVDPRIIFLGTPHSSSSIYNRLPDKGYQLKKFPCYDENGEPVEPDRFGEAVLEKQRVQMGESQFALQMMLDTSLADNERYPLKLSDLIISEAYSAKSCSEEYNVTIHPYGKLIKESKGADQLFQSKEKGFEVGYTKIIMSLDPAGGGDEFAWTIAGTRNGYIFILNHGAWSTGFNKAVLADIVRLQQEYGVHEIVIESNFNSLMGTNLIQPYVQCEVIPVRNHLQKERRIIATMEPLMNQQKLVVNKNFINDEILMSQMLNITNTKGSLNKDDRIDALAIACTHLIENVNINLHAVKDSEYRQRLDEELSDLLGTSGNYSFMDLDNG